jgi:thiosulfate dehydrogenase (quinone) large subunit
MDKRMVAPEAWIAVLRIVVGAWFFKAVWTKLEWAFAGGLIPYPAAAGRFVAFHPKRVAEFAAGNPIEWYKHFLQETVLPNAHLFATLQAYGEAAVGLGLLLGLLTGLAALVGLYLSVNFGLATQWMSSGQQGFHVLLVTSMLILLFTRAGRVAGIDGLVLGRATAAARRWLRLVM